MALTSEQYDMAAKLGFVPPRDITDKFYQAGGVPDLGPEVGPVIDSTMPKDKPSEFLHGIGLAGPPVSNDKFLRNVGLASDKPMPKEENPLANEVQKNLSALDTGVPAPVEKVSAEPEKKVETAAEEGAATKEVSAATKAEPAKTVIDPSLAPMLHVYNAAENAVIAQGKQAAAAAGEIAGLQKTLKNMDLSPENIQKNLSTIQDSQAAQQAIQQELKTRKQDLDAITAKYDGMSVDSKHYWSEKTSGQKVMAAIGIFLGGLGNKANPALEIINKAIDNDMTAQKSNIDKAGNRINQQRGLLQDLRLQLGDERAAESAARGIIINAVQNQMSLIAAKVQNQGVAANAQKGAAELEIQKMKFYQDAIEKMKTQQVMNYLGGGNNSEDAAIYQLIPETEKPKFISGVGIRGLAKTPKEAEEINESAKNVNEAVRLIDKLVGIGKKHGRQSLPSEASHEAKATAAMLLPAIKDVLMPKLRLNSDTMDILEELVSNPTKVKQLHALNGLEFLKNNLIEKFQQDPRLKNGMVRVDPNYGKIVTGKKVEGKR